MDKIDAIIFDMDGTLLRLGWTDEDMKNVRCRLRQYFRNFGIEREFRPLLSTIRETIEELSERVPPERLNSIAKNAFQIVDENEVAAASGAKARDGVRNLLDNLKEKYKLGIVTSNGRRCALVALETVGIPSELFSVLIAREDTRKHKPHPAPLLLALEKLNLIFRSCNILFIGDHVYDMTCGKKAELFLDSGSITTIAITSGLCKETDLMQCPKADFLVHTFADVNKIIHERFMNLISSA